MGTLMRCLVSQQTSLLLEKGVECKGANGTLDFYVLDVSVCVNCLQFWLFVQLGLVHED